MSDAVYSLLVIAWRNVTEHDAELSGILLTLHESGRVSVPRTWAVHLHSNASSYDWKFGDG